MLTNAMGRINDLVALGWTKEGAEFLVEKVDAAPNDPRSITVRRRLFAQPVKRRPSRPIRTKAFIPPALRWQVWERDNFTCQHCGTRQHLTVDHIMAESCGGTLDFSNLQTLCAPCNSRKGAR